MSGYELIRECVVVHGTHEPGESIRYFFLSRRALGLERFRIHILANSNAIPWTFQYLAVEPLSCD
jgi:hypothetical protein